MTAIFCLRLAVGLMAALILLSPGQVNQRFYRAQLWIGLGLTVAAALFARLDSLGLRGRPRRPDLDCTDRPGSGDQFGTGGMEPRRPE